MLLPAAGCFNSEKDYEQLVEEKNGLAAELEAANRENEILTRALDNIKGEQEALQILLNTSRGRLTGASGGAGAPLPPPGSEPSPTVSWGGWEWSIPADALPDPASSPEIPAAVPPPVSSGRVYQPRPGDVLSAIAARNNTTVEELVELNPFLRSRRNYMIWETDRIRLP
jgi:LysM repeat protein